MSGLEVVSVVAATLAVALGVLVVVVTRAHRRQTARLQASIDALAAEVAATQRRRPEPPGTTAPALPAGASSTHRVVGEVVWSPEGRAVVAPTNVQVVDATLGRPLVRAAVIGHGLRRALRSEHRDRIAAMMRREFRRRRKLRLRAGRRAARLAVVRDDDVIDRVDDTGRGEVAS